MLPDSAAVEPLLAERDAIRGWLTRLNEAGNATPETVRTRVRADYESRLESITERLRDHADTIGARLEEDRDEHAGLTRRLETAQIALAEAELRHAVGEYDGDRFESEQKKHGDELAQVRQDIAATTERIERLESVYELVMQPIVPVASLAPTPVEVAPPKLTLVDSPPIVKPVEEERFEDSLLSVFDEPADVTESSDFSPLSFKPGSGMPPEVPRPQPARRFTPATDTPPLGVPQDALPRFSRSAEAIPSQPPHPVGEAVPVEPTPTSAAASTPASVPDALFGTEIVAGGAELTTPAARTLRCAECGAMNKPMEWYCEKCGAELTAA